MKIVLSQQLYMCSSISYVHVAAHTRAFAREIVFAHRTSKSVEGWQDQIAIACSAVNDGGFQHAPSIQLRLTMGQACGRPTT